MKLIAPLYAVFVFISSAFPAFAICVRPGEPFECVGTDCDITPGIENGQQHEIVPAENRLRVRAVDGALTADQSYAELYALVIEPERDMRVRANASVRFSGFLNGFGGGGDVFGEVEIRVIIRNLETDEMVAAETIAERNHDGGIGDNGIQFFENFFGPPFARDVYANGDDGAILEEGGSYGIGISARVRARGNAINPGESDYFSAGNGVFLNALRVVTQPTEGDPMFVDSDGDGLPDLWETEGVTDCDGNVLLGLHTFGADPDRKDLFVEIDWMEGREPRASSLTAVRAAFLAAPDDAGGTDTGEGITIWFDTGTLDDGGGVLVGDNLGGGNEIPEDTIPDPSGEFIPPLGPLSPLVFDTDIDDDGRRDFYEVKSANFDLVRLGIFHYMISAVPRNEDENQYPVGQGEIGGDDTVVYTFLPGALMHELGHNLGLRHGGSDSVNCKPNYLSVMNYSMWQGIKRRSLLDGQAQDVDNDGALEAQIIDFSPARTTTGRSRAPIFSDDEGLNEGALDETRELDEGDSDNLTIFFNEAGEPRDLALDAQPDWDNDGIPGETVSANVNSTGTIGSCDTDSIDELEGHDDWDIVQLRPVLDGVSEELEVNETGDTPLPEDEMPGGSAFDGFNEALNTVDLSVTKVAEPDLVMAGQEVTYTISVANAGPNSASEVIVTDIFDDLVTPVDLPDLCTATGSEVTCQMDVIASGSSRDLVLTGRVSLRVPCGQGDIVTLENEVSVSNGDWDDIASADNSATSTSDALCLRFEYAAKFICGDGSGDGGIRAVPGAYETIVNVHNFQSREIPFFKKLALAFPPREQAAGEILPIGIDRLGTDEALKADCDDLRARLFDTASPDSSFFEGYLVVQTPRRLDVDAVYTAGQPSGVNSIHVEEVTERDLRSRLSIEKRADVFDIPLPEAISSQFDLYFVLYTLDVFNGGVAAENVVIDDRVSLGLLGPVAGFLGVPEEPFEIPPGASRDPVQATPFPPAAEFLVTLPELAADAGAQIRFWAVVFTYTGDAATTSVTLANRAEVAAQGPDTSGADNTVEIFNVLHP